MIAKAQADYPQAHWQVMHAQQINFRREFDVIFSNAVIHWVPDHATLFRKMMQALTANGVLAIQMPLYHEMPVYALVDRLYREHFPHSRFAIEQVFNFHSADYYYELLTQMQCPFSLWETSYLHIVAYHEQILEMIQSTGLKPYLDEIHEDAPKAEFASAVLRHLPALYKRQHDDRILFPCKRLFLLVGNA